MTYRKFQSAVSRSFTNVGAAEEMTVVDISGDGVKEIVIPISVHRSTDFSNRPADSFDINYTTGTLDRVNGPQAILSGAAQDMLVADFDRNGIVDLLIGDHGVEGLGSDNNTLQPGSTLKLYMGTLGGMVDQSSVRGLGATAFWHSTDIGDINGDGAMDILTINGAGYLYSDANLVMFKNNGAGLFSVDKSLLAPSSLKSSNGGSAISVIEVRDMQGDGRPDLVAGFMQNNWVQNPNTGVRIYQNVNGNYDDAHVAHIARPTSDQLGRDASTVSTDKITVGDLNNDSLQDAVVMYADRVNDNARWAQILIQTSPNHYEDRTLQMLGTYKMGLPRTNVISGDSIEIVDINNDGFKDLHFTYNPLQDLSNISSTVYLNAGNSFVRMDSQPQAFGGSTNVNWARFTDVNGDGQTDLVYRTQDWNPDGSKDTKTTVEIYTGSNSFQTTAGQALQGSVFNDFISGSENNDTIYSGFGHDAIALRRGDDFLDGGPGSDTAILYGNVGNTVIFKEDDASFTARTEFGTKRIVNTENLLFTDNNASYDLNSIAIDPDSYLAANSDLMAAFGHNDAEAESHYVYAGKNEGRPTTFNTNSYLAGNPDLLAAFGHNKEAAIDHYIDAGRFEHRQLQGFNSTEYIASNPDLINAFHTNLQAGVDHYADAGFFEGRPTNTFNPQSYMAANPDVAMAYHGDAGLATLHYIGFGYDEHRPLSLTLAGSSF